MVTWVSFVFIPKYLTQLRRLAMDKRPSLLVRSLVDEEKNVFTFIPGSNILNLTYKYHYKFKIGFLSFCLTIQSINYNCIKIFIIHAPELSFLLVLLTRESKKRDMDLY